MKDNKKCTHCGKNLTLEEVEYLDNTCNECEWFAHMDFEVRETVETHV